MELPHFKYHPDPLATGSVKSSPNVCRCCGEARGYIYTSTPYAEESLGNCLCPWCIADGKAHQKFDAEFVDYSAIGEQGEWSPVPPPVAEEVAFRTPGFSGWQQEQWWTHCNDAAEFLGAVGYEELVEFGEEALQVACEVVSSDLKLQGEELERFIRNLNLDFGPTAYVFRCLHCRKIGLYWDCTQTPISRVQFALLVCQDVSPGEMKHALIKEVETRNDINN